MIKLYSLKQQKKDGEAGQPGTKRVSAAQLRIQKGTSWLKTQRNTTFVSFLSSNKVSNELLSDKNDPRPSPNPTTKEAWGWVLLFCYVMVGLFVFVWLWLSVAKAEEMLKWWGRMWMGPKPCRPNLDLSKNHVKGKLAFSIFNCPTSYVIAIQVFCLRPYLLIWSDQFQTKACKHLNKL